MGNSYLTQVTCLECKTELEFRPGLDRCPECGGVWLDARYDYEAVADIWRHGLSGREKSLWRYIELLPVLQPENINTMGEGTSPMVRATKIQNDWDTPQFTSKMSGNLPPVPSKTDRLPFLRRL